MKNIFLLAFSCFLTISASAQLDCDSKFTMRVIAESGLNMRSEPSLRSGVVTTVPYDSTLIACQSTAGEITYDKITGYWRKSVYKGKVGYMFDGFLEIIALKAPEEDTSEVATDNPPAETPEEKKPLKKITPEKTEEKAKKYQFVTESYNVCGDVQEINPGLEWYGFYPANTDEGEVNYQVKRVELSVVLSRTRLGEGLEFDIETDREERSIFLVGMPRKITTENIHIEDKSEMLRYAGRKIFPGQELNLQEREPPISLTATGSVESSSGPCPELKNYKLILKSSPLGVEQNLTSELPSGKCGLPEIYWFGDFTGDGLPEIIFVSVDDEQNTFSLFISDPALQNALVRKEAEWTLKECE